MPKSTAVYVDEGYLWRLRLDVCCDASSLKSLIGIRRGFVVGARKNVQTKQVTEKTCMSMLVLPS